MCLHTVFMILYLYVMWPTLCVHVHVHLYIQLYMYVIHVYMGVHVHIDTCMYRINCNMLTMEYG